MAPENRHGDGAGDREGNQKMIFVDTSLDTHLVSVVSDSDTVSSFKRKIMVEHLQCFPEIGDISIHCLKVKRRGKYYCLSDAMPVKSAFLASQKNWFLSVDASQLQQIPGPADRIPLPWVDNSGSIVTHDSQADRFSKLSLIYESPSKHLKIAPFVNQNAPTVDHFTSDDNLCKKLSKNIEEEKSSHHEHCRNLEPDLEQQLDSKVEEKVYSVNKEKKSKKRIPHRHKEDASVKKKRCKTQRVEGDIRGSEEDRVLTDDIGKVNDMEASEDAALDVVVTKAMKDEHTRTILVSQKKQKKSKKGKRSVLVQVATDVPSSVKDAREEMHSRENTEASNVIPDVAIVVETDIQQEMPVQSSQKKTENELVQEADVWNEVPSSSIKGVTAEEELLVRHADDLVDMSLTVPSPVFDEKIKVKSKNEDAALDVIVTKVMDDEHKGTMLVGQKKPKRLEKGKSSAHEQVATVITSSIKDTGEEMHSRENTEASNVIADVAMVVETDIQQEMPVQLSQKETGNELVQEADIGNDVLSSSMKGVTAEEELLARHADDLVDMSLTVPTPVFDEKIKEKSKNEDAALDVVVTKVMDDEHTGTMLVSQKNPKRTEKGKSSAHEQVARVIQQETLFQDAGEEIHPRENTEASNSIPDVAMVVETNIQQETLFQSSQKEKGNELIQEADIGNGVPSSLMKATAEEELPVKHADDLVDMSSTIPTPVFPEKVIDEQKKDKANIVGDAKNEVSWKTSIDDSLVYDNNGDDLIVKEVKNAEATESHRNQAHQEKPRKEIKETAGSTTKEIDAGKSALRKDEIVKHSSIDAETGTNEETLLLLPEIKEKITPVDALHVDHGRNDDNLETETIASQLIADIPEKQNENMGNTKKKNKGNRKTKKSTARKEGENGDLLEKIADVSQEDVADGDKHKSKDAEICDEGLVKEAKKNHISVTSAHFDMPSKLELEPEKSKAPEETMKDVTVSHVPKGNDEGIADVPSKIELEPEISKIPEETTKNLTVSQAPKGNDVNSDVGTPQEGAREIDLMDHFSPDIQPNNIAAHDNGENTKLSMRGEKLKKKSQQDSRNDSAIHSPSRNENKKDFLSSKKIPEGFADGVGVKDRNASNNAKVKTQKRKRKVDAPKTSNHAQVNKPQPSSKLGSSSESFVRSSKSQKVTKKQPTMGQTQVKNLKKSVPRVKSLLNTPETIFGDNSDDISANDNATINSDSSTHTPSGTSSSSGESDSSVYMRRVKRKEAAGKNNTNSQSKLKKFK